MPYEVFRSPHRTVRSVSGKSRNIERSNHNFEQANFYHQQAVELLEKIAAKCDLAEAYLQWGITLKHNQQVARSKDFFAKAIAIYQKIPAPKQVKRVQNSKN